MMANSFIVSFGLTMIIACLVAAYLLLKDDDEDC